MLLTPERMKSVPISIDSRSVPKVGINRDNREQPGVQAWSDASNGTVSNRFRRMVCSMKEETQKARITKLNRLIDSLCGIYTRVARQFGVHRTFVSRVARGERRSEPIESALAAEYERAKKT